MSCARVKSLFMINLYRQTSNIVASQYIYYTVYLLLIAATKLTRCWLESYQEENHLELKDASNKVMDWSNH